MSPPLLPRFHRKQIEAQDAAALREILIDTGDAAPLERLKTPATKPGDTRQLRGIPVIGGVGGTQPGTDPVSALLRKDKTGGI